MVVEELRERRMAQSLRVGTRTGNGVLAFLLWEMMNRYDSPRPPHQIAFVLGTTTQDMQKAEKDLGISPTYCKPSAYVEKICGDLGLNVSYKMVGIIKSVVQCVDHYMHKPETIIGAVILQIISTLNTLESVERKAPTEKILPWGKRARDCSHMTCARKLWDPSFVSNMCDLLQVPKSSLHGLVKKLPDECESVMKTQLYELFTQKSTVPLSENVFKKSF